MNILKLNKPFHIFLLVTILTTFSKSTLAIDSKFKSCEPQTCQNGPTIRYPFWLSNQQESFCGDPNFQITCKNNNPVIRISNDDYVIKEIFYSNQSFLVANAIAYTNHCPVPQQNFSLNGTPFTFSSSHIDLSFFYKCKSVPSDYILVDCHSNQTLRSFAAFKAATLQHENLSLDSCQSLVTVPCGAEYDILPSMNYTDILKMGFVLNWTTQNCSGCEASGGHCGFDDANKFVCFCGDHSHSKACDDGPNYRTKIAIGVGAGFGGIIIMCVVFLGCKYRRKKMHSSAILLSRSISSNVSMAKDIETASTYLGVHVFTYDELVIATNNFDCKKELGDGGFGTVYYGKLKDGRGVAVKRLYENNYRRVEQFMNEIEILAHVRHVNLVSLYGCTSRHSRELLLVYEFVPNGTVADHLHGDRGKSSGGLSWATRLNIALETANALAYLHASEIIHRDVKTNNILLDKNFTVKVADFGLSRLFPNHMTHVSTAPQGTPGYVDPDYHQCYQLTSKSDVFSFGVVLMELVSSMPAVDITRHRHDINLSTMAINRIQNHALGEIVDPTLGFDSDPTVRKMITAVAELAFQCLQHEKDMRPCMGAVLEELKTIQSRDYGDEKAAKMVDASSADDAVLLKNGVLTLSPDSVTVNWDSRNTTPHASN